jgi:hypothetical protein
MRLWVEVREREATRGRGKRREKTRQEKRRQKREKIRAEKRAQKRIDNIRCKKREGKKR